MIAIIDGGGANIASVRFALERLGVAGELTADPAIIASAERVILPESAPHRRPWRSWSPPVWWNVSAA